MRQWYQPHLEQRYPDAVVRAGDLDQLQRIAAGYPSRAKFLTDLVLDPPSATCDEAGAPLLDEDYLILSTIHSAKGQESKAVFILNVVDGCIPSDMAAGSVEDIEEERLLLYVAMTRAKRPARARLRKSIRPLSRSRVARITSACQTGLFTR